MSNVKVTRPLVCSPPCWRVRWLQRWAWERVGRGKLLLRCRLVGGARRFGTHGGGEGRRHIVAAARLQVVIIRVVSAANALIRCFYRLSAAWLWPRSRGTWTRIQINAVVTSIFWFRFDARTRAVRLTGRLHGTTDRSVRLVCPTSRMKRLHVPIVGPTGRSDPGYVRLVCQTSRTDRSDRL